ncbi:phosphate ABC transporter substrate-binding protein [Reinekea sp. G2M2-21]|uniref:phosphate ABC transporter substrate-binding protein n=1 Tax=Reinekea sp. G2M2-21 TaxID=2788942 RepID=UPI0018A93FD1|nr:phosphate ABC transporter substrate-binding protein [Reinekea sp. G2M2-21]
MRKNMIIKRVIATTLFCLSLIGLASADLLVIVHPENTNTIDARFVKNLYLGKENQFDNGDDAEALMLDDNNELTELFLKEIVNQKPVQFKRLWSKALFTGKGTPPQVLASSADVLRLVMSNPTMVGYIDSEAYTNDVRAVLRIKTK